MIKASNHPLIGGGGGGRGGCNVAYCGNYNRSLSGLIITGLYRCLNLGLNIIIVIYFFKVTISSSSPLSLPIQVRRPQAILGVQSRSADWWVIDTRLVIVAGLSQGAGPGPRSAKGSRAIWSTAARSVLRGPGSKWRGFGVSVSDGGGRLVQGGPRVHGI